MIETAPIVKCQEITKLYGLLPAVNKFSLTVNEPGIWGILGGNGAGKTTLLRIVAGLLKPNTGNIFLWDHTFDEFPLLLKSRIGIMLDEPILYYDLTIRENLHFFLSLYENYDKKVLDLRIEDYAKQFQISNWLDEPVGNLSRGMKKKVDFIRVLLQIPQILILDEPFAALDFNSIQLCLNLLAELQQTHRITIFISLHEIELATKIADQILVLKRGKVNLRVSRQDFDLEKIKSAY